MRAFLNRLWRARRAVFLYAVLLLAGWMLGDLLRNVAVPDVRPMNEPMIHSIVMVALLIFVIAAAIPFVPGAEVGFALLFVFGTKAVLVVYVAMVGALVLSYCIARVTPSGPLIRALSWLGLKRAADFASDLETAEGRDRVRVYSQRLPSSLGRKLLNNRYLLLAVALNTPGNSIVGGGGGLAFMAGMSGLFGFWQYLAVILCAVAPVPLLFFLTGGSPPF